MLNCGLTTKKAAITIGVQKRGGAENANELADLLKEEFEDAAPDLGASTFSDLLGYALGLVNWYEIAEMLIEEHREG